MKKIIFLINTLGCGGAEHVLVDIANNLNKTKFDVTIKTIYNDNIYKGQLNKNVHYKTFCGFSKNNNFVGNLIRKITTKLILTLPTKMLYRIFVGKEYDIEVAFLEGIPTKIMSGSCSNAKKIAWVHTDMFNNRESLFCYKSNDDEKQSYEKFDEIYCVSKSASRAFIKRFGLEEKVYAVNNIIDDNKVIKLSKISLDFSFKKNSINIVTVGRLEKVKAFDRLIECYYKIRNDLKYPVNIYIVGDGSQYKQLQRIINKKELNNEIFLLGYQSNPYKFIKNADFYVCGSLVEGSSLTIKEALTLSKPILVTNCGIDLDNFKNGDYGLIVDNSCDGIEHGLLKMINSSDLIENMSRNIKNNYKPANDIKNIENIILK